MRTQLHDMLQEAGARGLSEDSIRGARELYAKSSFDLAWQLRLEGAHEDLWREAASAACQQYRHLSQNSLRAGDSRASTYQENLEMAVRLSITDPGVLAGMPFPPNCYSTSNCEKKAQRERDQLSRKNRPPGQDPRDQRNEEEEDMKQSANASGQGIGW